MKRLATHLQLGGCQDELPKRLLLQLLWRGDRRIQPCEHPGIPVCSCELQVCLDSSAAATANIAADIGYRCAASGCFPCCCRRRCCCFPYCCCCCCCFRGLLPARLLTSVHQALGKSATCAC